MAKKNIKVQNRIKKQKPDNQWFQNVAKSMGFTAADIVKDLLPNTNDFLEYTASDTFKMISDMKSNMSSRQMVNRQFKNIPQIKIANDAIKNMKSDLMSGKLYNKSRSEEFDFDDMDFGFGAFDDGDGMSFIDDDNDSGSSEDKTTHQTVINTLPLAKMINNSTEATVSTMVAVAEQQMAVESEKLLFNHRSTNSILGGLSAINDNLSTLVRFNADSTAKYHAASLKYYEESLEYIKTAGKKSTGNNTSEEVEKHARDIYTYKGNLIASEYKKIIKDNIKELREENAMLSDALNILTDTSTIKDMAKNPIGTIMNIGIKSMIPAITKSSMKALDDSISSIIPAIMTRINSMEDDENPFKQAIFKVFGHKNKLSYDVDLGKYEKGSVSWDGESKKALVEVIPAYLRRIESALTGNEERIFSYSKGKFTNAKKLKEEYDKELAYVEGSGYTEFRTKMRNIANNMNANVDVMEQFEKDMAEYFSEMTKLGSFISPITTKDSDGIDVDMFENLGLFDYDINRVNFMKKVLRGLSNKEITKMATVGIYDSRRSTQRYMDEIRKNPNISGYSSLFNEGDETKKVSYLGNRGISDKFGLTQLDYLRDIRSALINGIKVFPDNQKRYRGWKPNNNLLKKELDENKTIKSSLKENSSFSNKSYNYDEILGLSEKELENIYRKSSDEDEFRDNKLSSKFSKKFASVNKGMNKLTSVIDAQVYKILFGSDTELIEDARNGIKNTISKSKNMPGIIESTKGFFQDTIKGVGSYFTGLPYIMSDGTKVEGNPDSILGKFKSFFTGSIDKLTDGEKGGLIGRLANDFMDGFNQFKVTLFGNKKLKESNTKETLSQLMDKIKPRLPKAIASGLGTAMIKTALASKMGVLGSILLPGGPMGAALIGATTSFLSQSETFRNWLFGEKNEEGQRMGGFIPKSLVDSIERNGGTIKKGAVLGGAVGFLPSFFLPGGPVTGAILGVAGGLMTKSDAFQEFLYGKDFKDKDSRSMMNGAFGKLYKNSIGKVTGEGSNPKLAAFLGGSGVIAGVAQGVGLLPSFLLPGGPVLGAMLGLAGGITASSDKFQEFLFGEKDVDGKRYGGLVTKFTNWFDTAVVNPLKIKASEVNDKIYGFLKSKVFNPIIDAFAPIKQAGLFMLEDAKNAVSNMMHKVTDPIVNSFTENVAKPLGNAMKKILDPIGNTIKKSFSLFGKALLGVATSPIKLLTGLGNMANAYNEKRVMRDERKQRLKGFRDEMATNFSFSGLIKGFGNQFISSNEEENILNSKLSYREARNNRRKNKGRDEALEAELQKRANRRAEMQKQFEENMAFGKQSGWKFASKKQMEAREKELKDKQAWFQEKTAVEMEETKEKISKISELIKDTPKNETEKIDTLKEIKNLLKDNLKRLTNGEAVDNLKDTLRGMGQSHADGLDEVPNDGYIAELHQGEMVVPKKPAGLLRGMIKNNNSLLSKLFNNDKKDRADNALGLTEFEESQMNELEDRDRKTKVSRKSVDYLQNKAKELKKEKEEKQWKDSILGAIHGVTNAVSKGTKATGSFFDNILSAIGKLPGLLGKILGSLGLGGSLATIATALGLNAYNEYSKTADEWGASTLSVAEGYAREERLDADGMFVYDNQVSSTLGKFGHKNTRKAFMKPIQVAGEKIIKPTIEKGKMLLESSKPFVDKTKNVISNGVTKIDNYINPKIQRSGQSFLGTAYNYTGDVIDKSARKGIAKPIGAVVDTAKTASQRASNIVTKFINVAKSAVLELQTRAAKKFPGLGKITKQADDILAKLLKNSDTIYRKWGSKISTFIIDTAADATPVGAALELCTTAYDVLSGYTKGNAGNLFGVPESHVDMDMKNITAFLQGLCGFSFMAIIWIINEITSSLYGFDFMQNIARWIYQALPVNLGKVIDLSMDFTGKIDGMSTEEAIKAAGGNLEDFIDRKTGKLKDLSKLSLKDISGTGVSTAELMELQRLQYNNDNGTKLDSNAWKDKTSKTLGEKILGNDWVKNFKGSFQSQSIKGHMGLNTDAKLSLTDRLAYLYGSIGVNLTNHAGKMFNIDALKNVSTEKLFNGYAEKREEKYNKKISKADKKITKYQDKLENANNPLTKAFYQWRLNANTKKKEKAQAKIGTTKKKSMRQQQIEAMQNGKVSNSLNTFSDKNSANQNLKDINMTEYEAYGMAALGDDTLMGKGDGDNTNTKTLKKATQTKAKKNNTTDKVDETTSKVTKTVNSSFTSLNKSVKKSGDSIKKGLDTSTKTVTKSFNDINKTLTKYAKDIKKKFDKENKSNVKTMEKETKNLTKSFSTILTNMKKKVNDMAKGIKNIKVKSVSTISPTFSMDNPKKFFEDLIDKVFKKNKEDNNAGSSGISSNSAYSVRSNSDSGFIQPTNTTNNNNKFVFYSQNDRRWANTKIGDKSMSDAGCGPTSIAMTISQLTGEEITPDTIAALGKKELPGYSTYNLFPEIAKKFGMNYEDTENEADIIRNLKEGTPVLLSGRGNGIDSPYTKDGHIVVANSIEGDNVFVSDPRGKNYSKSFKLSSLMGGLKKAMVLKPTSTTKNRLSKSKGKIPGVKGLFTDSLNSEIGAISLSPKLLKENMGGDGNIRLYEKVLGYAKAFEKKLKYIYGSKGIDKNKLTSDCSGFTHHVFERAAGIDIGHGSVAQHKAGSSVNYNDAQPADLIVFDGHAGIVYDSNKNMIDIGSGTGPVIRSYDTSYWKGRNPVIRRVLSDPNKMVSSTIDNPNTALGVTSVNGLNLGDISGSSSSTNTSSSTSQDSDPLGVFGKLSNIGQNMMASIFNGKQVDLFASPTSSDGSSSSLGGTTDISGISDTKQAVWQYFTSRGFSKEATAGIMGNMQQESTINPRLIQGNGRGPAAGICQWENYNKKTDRWKKMADYAASKGKEWTDLQSQLEYVEMELGGIGGVDTYTNTLLKRKIGGLDQFKSLTDINKATEVFENSFERAGIKVMDKRKRYASEIYKQMTNSAGMGPATATSAQSAPTDGSIPTSMNGWAYYKQGDPKWNANKIGGATVSGSGCGPTSHAMLLTSLFGQQITPDVMSQWGYNNGTWSGDGMYWSMPDKVASEFGLSRPKTWTGKSSQTIADIKSSIKSGNPVVLSGRGKSNNLNTPFTTGGHIVLAVGVDGNNRLIINDPRGPQYTKAYEDSGLTDYGTGLRGAWAFADSNNKKIPANITAGGSWNGSSYNTTSTSDTSAPEVDSMGVFGKLSTIGQNMVSSVFGGTNNGTMGSGDGKTYWAKGFGDNKPKEPKVSYSGSMGRGEDNTNVTQNYINSKRSAEKSIRQLDRTNVSLGMGEYNNSSMTEKCISVLSTIVEELQAINTNTAATANGINNIEIASSNTPINTSNNLNKTTNGSTIQPNSNTGYDIARRIASYK